MKWLAIIVVGGLITAGCASTSISRLANRDNLHRQLARRKTGAAGKALASLRRLEKTGYDNLATINLETADILRQYVADRYAKLSETLTSADCTAALNIDHDNSRLVQQFCDILESCDQTRFGGSVVSAQAIDLQHAATVIKSLTTSALK